MPRTKGSKNCATTSVDFDAQIKKLQKDKAMLKKLLASGMSADEILEKLK